MVREVSLEALPNVNIREQSHDKNLPIMSVTGLINQNVFKSIFNLSFMGPWYSGTQCGMRIPRPEFKSQRVP